MIATGAQGRRLEGFRSIRKQQKLDDPGFQGEAEIWSIFSSMTFQLRGWGAREGRWGAALLLTAAALFIGDARSAALAEPPDAVAARRTVKVFDFEEPNNPESIPGGWRRAQSQPNAGGESNGGLTVAMSRPGFPEYNRAEFDFTTGHASATSVRLPTKGGSVSLRLQPGELPVFPDADYQIAAWIKTSDLHYARAFVAARLLDQQLEPVAGSEVRSVPIVSPQGWTQVAVALPSAGPNAAWIQIDLELLQPQQFRAPASGAAQQHEIWREDVKGEAWFDNVGVYQVPRAKLWTDGENNVVEHDHAPTMWMQVRDLTGQKLRGSVRVMDVFGKIVDSQERSLDPGARAASWTPRLPGYGWYKGVLDVQSEGDAVSRAEVTFAYLAPKRAKPPSTLAVNDRHRFGIIAEELPETSLDVLPGLAKHVGTGFMSIPAFDPTQPAQRAADVMHARAKLYDALLDESQQITLVTSRIPEDVTRQLSLDPDDAAGMFSREAKYWYPFLEPTLDVYGQRLVRYQLGPTGDTHSVRRDLVRPLSALEAALSRLVPNPSIALSWRAEFAAPSLQREVVNDQSLPDAHPVGALVDAVVLDVPASFSAPSVGEITSKWMSTRMETGAETSAELTVVPELPSADEFGGDAPVIELVRRAVEFWAVAGEQKLSTPARLGLRAPVNLVPRAGEEADSRAPHALPTPVLPAIATLIDQLAGRRVVSTLPAPAGVRAYVLASGVGHSGGLDDGCVVAWNESSPSQHVTIDVAPAGNSVTVVDVFGNARVLNADEPKVPGGATPMLSVEIGELPVYIQGVDPYLAMFVAGFKIDPSYIPAVVTEHEHTLKLTNPWPVRITGKLQLRDGELSEPVSHRPRPDEWKITPYGLIDFAISPGETISIPMTITLGAGQLAGTRDFVVVARVNADRQYPPIRLKVPIEIGLPTIDLIPEVRLSPTPDGPDVVITATVTNKDTRARVLKIEAAASNQATQQQQISDLAPGQTTLRRFVFRNAAKALSGRRVFLTLTEAEGAERLNRAVNVP